MNIRLVTRHSERFDIYTKFVDPRRSPYANGCCVNYVEKICRFYAELGIESAVWTNPELPRAKYFETDKPIEYLLEVNAERIVAYVNEMTWSPYLEGKRQGFEYTRTRQHYEETSILVLPPIQASEVKARRRYRSLGDPQHYEMIEELVFDLENPYRHQPS